MPSRGETIVEVENGPEVRKGDTVILTASGREGTVIKCHPANASVWDEVKGFYVGKPWVGGGKGPQEYVSALAEMKEYEVNKPGPLWSDAKDAEAVGEEPGAASVPQEVSVGRRLQLV